MFLIKDFSVTYVTMKKIPKGKQAPKGNLKISNFFTKLSSDKQIHKPGDTKNSFTKTEDTCQSFLVESDFVDFDVSLKHKSRNCDHCNTINTKLSPAESELARICTPSKSVETRTASIPENRCTHHVILSHKRKNHSPEKHSSKLKRQLEVNCSTKSGVTSSLIKHNISVKTPEKLFAHSVNTNLSPDELTVKTESWNNSFEVCHSPKSPLKTNNCNSISGNIDAKQTPSKSKSPKVHQKSPKKLEDFNIQIIGTITPSKSNRLSINYRKTPESSTKKQVSILKYLSPSPSRSALQAQALNETTPKREIAGPVIITPKHSKVKTKLDFSEIPPIMPIKEEKPMDITSDEKENSFPGDMSMLSIQGEFDEDWHESFNTPFSELNLDLKQSVYCKVLESILNRARLTIKVQSISKEDKAVCYLEGFWVNMQLKPGDILHLSAEKHPDGNWIVNNEVGLVVYEPDLLISSTSIVGSLFCLRHSVLSVRYQGFEPPNRAMLVGTFVHKLLQNSLKNNINTKNEIENSIEVLLSSNCALRDMYQASISFEDVKKELMEYVPRIVSFIKQYVKNDKSENEINSKNNIPCWNGKISSIDDIEENIWCRELGVKGKVDLSVNCGDTIIPLELKTGRASMSLEHKGQVMLYIMMMNKLGYEISSGLLLYLKESLLTQVNITPQESRDIILLRNELAYYLTKQPVQETTDDDDNMNLLPELPEPIDHSRGCGNCSYNVVCSALISRENLDFTNKTNYVKIQKQSISHLDKTHLDYFNHWSYLLLLENVSQKETKAVQEIYTIPAEERAKQGRCINDVILTKTEIKSESVIEHTFNKNSEKSLINFLASGIEENNYVVISTDSRPAVATGFITYIDANSVIVSIEKDLNKKCSGAIFHIDTYDSSVSCAFNLTSLALLLEDSPRASHLRKIIINKEAPTFLPKLPKIVATKSLHILRRLNKIQQRAVLKSITAKDFLLIKGMPGTGKTATIVALIQLLVAINKSVLITSHTHSAVDNVCVRLQKFGVDVLRLGSTSKLDDKLKSRSEFVLTKDCKTPEEIEEIYNKAHVIAVTCLGSGHPLLSKRTVDVCIVDESTQVLQTSVLRALFCAKTFILIGDPDQLPPVIKCREAVRKGMSESLFERLQNNDSCVTLNQNYRMNKTITALANDITYKGELLIGSDEVANAHLSIPQEVTFKVKYADNPWIIETLDTSLKSSVQIINVDLTEAIISKFAHLVNCSEKSSVNIFEAGVIIRLVKILLETGVPCDDIGIMATYKAQAMFISKWLANIDVSTVDQFQGKDKSVIFYSCTKYKHNRGSKNEFEILEDQRRLTVAVTRAKHKLIILGDLKVVREYTPISKLLHVLDEEKFITLLNGKNGFCWDDILCAFC